MNELLYENKAHQWCVAEHDRLRTIGAVPSKGKSRLGLQVMNCWLHLLWKGCTAEDPPKVYVILQRHGNNDTTTLSIYDTQDLDRLHVRRSSLLR